MCAMVEAGCQRGVSDSVCGSPGWLELTQDPFSPLCHTLNAFLILQWKTRGSRQQLLFLCSLNTFSEEGLISHWSKVLLGQAGKDDSVTEDVCDVLFWKIRMQFNFFFLAFPNFSVFWFHECHFLSLLHYASNVKFVTKMTKLQNGSLSLLDSGAVQTCHMS